MNKYIIIDAEAIEKRIEELENTEAIDRQDGIEIYKEMYVLKQILSKSTPLIPEIEDAYDAGKLDEEFSLIFDNPKGKYISNLKFDI